VLWKTAGIASLAVFFLFPCLSFSYQMPDTGQTIVYSTATGDDGYYNGSQLSYTLQYHIDGSTTTTDNNTGLVWWYTGSSVSSSWEAAISSCEASNLGGFTDWRLPNIRELVSIVDYSRYNPPVAVSSFTIGSAYTNHWSGTTYKNGTTAAWYVNFITGAITNTTKTAGNGFRCVRGPFGDNSVSSSTEVINVNIVNVSTTAAGQLNPGIWGYFNAGDVSFWFGVLMALVVIFGYKAGGFR